MQAQNEVNFPIEANDFEDVESRVIFKYRKAFCETGDWTNLVKMITETYRFSAGRINKKFDEQKSDFINEIAKHNKKVVLFGAGLNGTKAFELLTYLKVDVSYFCDNNEAKQKDGFLNKKVFSVSEIVENANEYLVVIPNGYYANSMKSQLLEDGFPEDQIHILKSFEFDYLDENTNIEEVLLNEKNKISVYGIYHHDLLFSFMLEKAGKRIEVLCNDTDKPVEIINNYKVVTLEQLVKDHADNYVVVLTRKGERELLDSGFSKSQIIRLTNTEDLQYFDSSVLNRTLKEKQVFVDGGSLNLGTSLQFLDWCNENCEAIYAFEPDNRNIKLCQSQLKYNRKLKEVAKLFKNGLWSEDTTVIFNNHDISGASFIEAAGMDNVSFLDMNVEQSSQLECTSIDNATGGGKVTFIKLDIEGSELEALKGAKNTILKYKPIIAVSMYHKPEDIVEIPSYLKSLVPEYKLYLRNYHVDHTETVMYAIAPEYFEEVQ